MARRYDPRLTTAAVRSRFNRLPSETADPWHRYTASAIREQLQLWRNDLFPSNGMVLNAGSGGDGLGVCPPDTLNIDISDQRLVGTERSVVGSVEALPLMSCCVDTIVCVGSVINYCDPAAAIIELGRVCRSGARMALEFESSSSAELLLRRDFGVAAAIVDTFYAGHDEVVWAYRPEYVLGLLNAAGFEVLRSVPIHVISPWLLLTARSLSLAALATSLDVRSRRFPWLTRWASNHLWLCQRK